MPTFTSVRTDTPGHPVPENFATGGGGGGDTAHRRCYAYNHSDMKDCCCCSHEARIDGCHQIHVAWISLCFWITPYSTLPSPAVVGVCGTLLHIQHLVKAVNQVSLTLRHQTRVKQYVECT